MKQLLFITCQHMKSAEQNKRMFEKTGCGKIVGITKWNSIRYTDMSIGFDIAISIMPYGTSRALSFFFFLKEERMKKYYIYVCLALLNAETWTWGQMKECSTHTHTKLVRFSPALAQHARTSNLHNMCVLACESFFLHRFFFLAMAVFFSLLFATVSCQCLPVPSICYVCAFDECLLLARLSKCPHLLLKGNEADRRISGLLV